MRNAYYDREADIAWFPTGESDDVVSERGPGGLRDYGRKSHRLVAVEVSSASTRLPASLLDALPGPVSAHGTAALSVSHRTLAGMSAKEKLLARAPAWTEAEATAALRVVEAHAQLPACLDDEAQLSSDELDAREDAWAEQNAREAIREERW